MVISKREGRIITSMKRGYVHLWRKLWDHPVWREDRVFSRAEAWIDIIMWANGMDKEIIFDGKPFLIKRGQLLSSQRKLASRWHWGKTKTRDFLKYLQKHDHSIELISDHKKTLITLLNYELYNPLSNVEATTENDTQATTERPLKDHRQATTKKVKRKGSKNLSKEYFDFVDLLIEKMLQNDEKAKVPTTDKKRENWANDFRLLIEEDKRPPEEVRKILIWCQDDGFWQGNILSAAKFRKQYPALRLGMKGKQGVSKLDPAELTRKEMSKDDSN